jgi:hypothetical protein
MSECATCGDTGKVREFDVPYSDSLVTEVPCPELTHLGTEIALCSEECAVRDGPLEAHFVCLMPEGHDGHHQDPEWGVWE